MRNEEEAQDIVQDVFEKLWIHRNEVAFDKAKSWMFTTAHRAMINQVNRAKRSVLMHRSELPERGIENNTYELNQVIERAVSILPPLQKSIILLRDLEGYTYQDISEVLNITKSQVKVYLFRARKKIKKQLKGQVELV